MLRPRLVHARRLLGRRAGSDDCRVYTAARLCAHCPLCRGPVAGCGEPRDNRASVRGLPAARQHLLALTLLYAMGCRSSCWSATACRWRHARLPTRFAAGAGPRCRVPAQCASEASASGRAAVSSCRYIGMNDSQVAVEEAIARGHHDCLVAGPTSGRARSCPRSRAAQTR